MDRFVTVFTDASWCSETRSYGWAAWIKYGEDGETLRWWGGGYGMDSSQDAERYALDKAVSILLVSEVPLQDKVIVVRSDCDYALMSMETERLYKAGARAVRCKHIKGHQGHRTRGSSVNTWCDRMARKEMRRYRRRLAGSLTTRRT